MIALGIFTLIALFAVFEAWQDFEIINNHEEVEHINAWMLRAFVTCYLWGAASIWIGWDAAIYAVASAFLFSAVFRISLNRMRGKDWRYIAPWGNYYDRLFYYLTFFIEGQGWPRRVLRWDLVAQAYKEGWLYDGVILWGVRNRVHRAGLYAYITELTIATACVMWAVLT
jgi:hypothetical protein